MSAKLDQLTSWLKERKITEVECLISDLTGIARGKISPTTWAFLGLASLWLDISLIGFGRGYSNASFNAGKRHQWIEVEKRPSWAFRPKKLGIENDIMMFLGLPLGLGFAIAGLMRLRDEKQSNPFFRIGQDQSCEYPTSDAPAGSFALVAPSSRAFCTASS